MRVVSFYSEGTLYEDEAMRLLASADRFDIPIDIIITPDAGSWHDNVAFKACVIHDELLSGDPVLYVDADAFFHVNPTNYFSQLEQKGYDFAARFRMDRLQSGTMWFSGSSECDDLIDNWMKRNEDNERSGIVTGQGQKNLQDVLPSAEVAMFELPAAWCYIFDTDAREHPCINPMIEHLQASRHGDAKHHSPAQRARRTIRCQQLERQVGACAKS